MSARKLAEETGMIASSEKVHRFIEDELSIKGVV